MPNAAMRGSEEDVAITVSLEHAVRRWNAETENAQRLGSRESGILAFVAAVLGLGVFRIEAIRGIEPAGAAWRIRILLGLALLATARALWKILLVKINRESTREGGALQIYASGNLKWPAAPELHPEQLAPRTARLVAYRLVTKSANSLYARNLSRKRSIDSGQGWLLLAAFLAGMAVLCYLFLCAKTDA